MISAGYIGGGEPVPPPEAQVKMGGVSLGGLGTAPDAFWGQLGGFLGKLGEAETKTAEATQTMANAQQTMADNQWRIAGINAASNLFQNLFAWLSSRRLFEMQEDINDRRMLAMENISEDRKETELKLLETQDAISRRVDGPGGTRERVARVEANRDIGMYDRRIESQERIAAMRNLDSASSARSEYNYGNPYA